MTNHASITDMRVETKFHQDLFAFNRQTGVFRTTYGTLSLGGNRPVFTLGEFGFNYLTFHIESKSGILVRYAVRRTIMRGDFVKLWMMTPQKWFTEQYPACRDTRVLLVNDLMF